MTEENHPLDGLAREVYRCLVRAVRAAPSLTYDQPTAPRVAFVATAPPHNRCAATVGADPEGRSSLYRGV